jgi:hypothetical protein
MDLRLAGSLACSNAATLAEFRDAAGAPCAAQAGCCDGQAVRADAATSPKRLLHSLSSNLVSTRKRIVCVRPNTSFSKPFKIQASISYEREVSLERMPLEEAVAERSQQH